MNFIHTADLHLGYRQYELDERFRDFGRSFLEVVEYAIAAKAEFVLVAGDLFNARNINAPTYMQAFHILGKLQSAGIPCLAIAGNHDRPFLRDHLSWLEALENHGLIRLLRPGEEKLMRGYVDIGGTRIFGMSYAGSSTSAIIPRIADEIREINAADPPEYTILMMHAGVEGQAKGNIIGETPYGDFLKLKGVVDYLALGHYHNAYALDGWAYNPGSPDTCSLSEVNEPKGFYHVRDGKAELKEVRRRPFIFASVRLDDHLDATSLISALEKKVASIRKPEEPPVVIVQFRGCPGFDRSHIDVEHVKQFVTEKLDPLYVDVRFDLSGDPFCVSGVETGGVDRAVIEREVLSRFAAADSMLSEYGHYFAASLSEVKDLAVKGADAETLDALMRKAFEDIRDRKAPVSGAVVVVKAADEMKPPAEPEPATPPAPKPAKERKKKAPAPPAEEPPAPKVQRKTLSEFWGGKP
ncbi:MAG: DNA double-strand break repair protein Mre11 [Methanocella sp. PtaU1.Bin125]|nr:MAG: DNA double-strand break repair protein Mre11 [Methanocella sp. PtaU1.Bin125]